MVWSTKHCSLRAKPHRKHINIYYEQRMFHFIWYGYPIPTQCGIIVISPFVFLCSHIAELKLSLSPKRLWCCWSCQIMQLSFPQNDRIIYGGTTKNIQQQFNETKIRCDNAGDYRYCIVFVCVENTDSGVKQY